MPSFEYKAIKPDGSEVTEVMEAKDSDAVTRYLDKLGYLPLKIKQSGGGLNLKLFSNRRKIKDGEIIIFTRQLVTLLRAGVPLLSCLDALVEQADSEGLKEIIEKIYVDIESGLSLSDAIKRHPKEFSELYINSIRAGEMGGALDKVLERLVELMEHEQETNARIKSAMRYPIIVVVTLVLAFVALMMLVVPNFIDLFTKMKIELPLPTRLLIGFHYVLSNYWYLVIAGLSAGAFGFFKYIKTEKGAFRWDQFMITVPIFGDLNLKTAMSRFTRMFETLNSSGLPILQTLEITAKTVGNIVIGKEIEKAAAGVLQGAGLAGPLAEGKIFPPMVIRMIAIGEQSGSLDTMLLNVSKHYDTEVEYAVKNLTSMIEPVLTVGVGVIVLFLALAIFLPMWSLTTLAQ
ncbi:type II secretion system F family protein [candidate division KSB1 bacterium]|nr:type II secretion system F family protein [candidate division KSB1 bacterium]